MSIKIINTGWLMAVILVLGACAPKANISTYWVNSLKGECTDLGVKECLLVQQNAIISPESWENFHAPIKGFNFEMGYLYQIQVKEEQLDSKNIPADASSIKYTLVKVLKKEADPKLRLSNIWMPTSLFSQKITPEQSTIIKPMRLEIHLKDKRIMGTDGCNVFNGNIATVGQDMLRFGAIASTRMMCHDMTWADKFNAAINKVANYKIKDTILYLYCDEGNELMTLKKAN